MSNKFFSISKHHKNPVGKQKAWRSAAYKLNQADKAECAKTGDPHTRQGRRNKNGIIGTQWAKVPTMLFQALMNKASFPPPPRTKSEALIDLTKLVSQ